MALRSLLLLIPFVAGACATIPAPTREAQRAAHTRTYPGIPPAQVYAAAEELFRLADGDDITISLIATGGVRAVRSWWFLQAAGEDIWTVHAAPEGLVTVELDRRLTMALVPYRSLPLDGPAVYDLFWRRMNYLLGQSATWTSCADYQRLAHPPGRLDPLCELTDDRTPTPETRQRLSGRAPAR